MFWYLADSDKVEASRKLYMEQQKKLVQHKLRETIEPVPGFLYKLRKEKNRIKLQSLGSLKVSISISKLSLPIKHSWIFSHEMLWF